MQPRRNEREKNLKEWQRKLFIFGGTRYTFGRVWFELNVRGATGRRSHVLCALSLARDLREKY